jgi:hypothetical protein
MHHYVKLQHERQLLLQPLVSRNSNSYTALHCSRSVHSPRNNGRCLTSNRIHHNSLDSSGYSSPLLAVRTRNQSGGNHNNGRRPTEHLPFSVSSRYFSSNSAEKSEEKIESNGYNPETQSKDDKTQQAAVNDDDSNRYYYLIKQKYSPSRHQKYRPSKNDGTLEKTVSNKPLKDRIIQSNSDVVAYFMPKGSHSIPSILILILILILLYDLFLSIMTVFISVTGS